MFRAIVGVFALTLGSLPACDSGTSNKDAEAKVLERDREIAALKQQIATLSAKPDAPPADARPAAPTGPSLDADIVRAASTAQGVQKLKLESEADGSLRELSLYHNDKSALPEAVLALREKQYPGSQIRAYETEFEREHGRIFEVEVTTKDGQECEYSAKPDGTLVYNECHIDPKTLPEAVRAAVTTKLPGAEILEAEQKTYADGHTIYSVELRAAGKVHELYYEGDQLIRHELVIPAQLEVPAP